MGRVSQEKLDRDVPGSFYQEVVQQVLAISQRVYGPRLISLVVYGSVGRRTPQPDSDIDLLLVVDDLSPNRWDRLKEFQAVENEFVQPWFQLAEARFPACPCLSPVIKSREECRIGSPLFLDMIEDAWIVLDQDNFFSNILACLQARLTKLGSRRIWQGSAWYWDLKPDYKLGDEIEI